MISPWLQPQQLINVHDIPSSPELQPPPVVCINRLPATTLNHCEQQHWLRDVNDVQDTVWKPVMSCTNLYWATLNLKSKSFFSPPGVFAFEKPFTLTNPVLRKNRADLFFSSSAQASFYWQAQQLCSESGWSEHWQPAERRWNASRPQRDWEIRSEPLTLFPFVRLVTAKVGRRWLGGGERLRAEPGQRRFLGDSPKWLTFPQAAARHRHLRLPGGCRKGAVGRGVGGGAAGTEGSERSLKWPVAEGTTLTVLSLIFISFLFFSMQAQTHNL